MNDQLIGQIIIQLILIVLNAIFACAEIAVITINDNKLEQLSIKGNKRATRLLKLTSDPAGFLATIQVAITLSGFLGSAFAADGFSPYLVSFLKNIGLKLSESTLDTIALVIITLILSYFTLVLGELVPKRIAMKKTEEIALAISGIVAFISVVFAPIVWGLTKSTNAILRLMKIDPNEKEDEVSEEEIRMMVEIGTKKGVINPQETLIIQNVFEFDDLSLEEIATHRKDMIVLWEEESLEEWDKTIQESRYSQYPVCTETSDDIIGILNIKDYFRMETKTKEKVLKEAVKPAYFVPETIKADVLFAQMKKTKNHFAIVLDEYGGTMGIITMNDLLEQLVGELEDFDSKTEDIIELEEIAPNKWRIAGSTSLDEVAEKLEVELPLDEYDTFSGYVFGMYGIVPDDGSIFEIESDGLVIRVIEIKEHRIKYAIVTKIPSEV